MRRRKPAASGGVCGCRARSRSRLSVFSFFLCCALLIIQGGRCLHRYFEGKTSISVEIRDSTGADLVTFPDFSVCLTHHQHGDGELKHGVLREFNLTEDQYWERDFPDDFDLKNLTLRQLNRHISYGPAELLHDVYVNTYTFGVFRVSMPFNDTDIWTEYPLLKWGNCHTMRIPSWVRKHGVKTVAFLAKGNISILLQHPGQVLELGTNDVIVLKSGKFISIDCKYDLTQLMESEEEAGLAHGQRGYQCLSESDFGFDECLYRKTAERLCQDFNCSSPFLPGGECPDCDLVSGFDSDQRSRFHMSEIDYLRHMQLELCPSPCAILRVEKSLPRTTDLGSEYELGSAALKLYFNKKVNMRQMHWTYGAVSMVAEIGGYTGLLLGVSLYQVSGYLCKSRR